jgi:hypothetical protein
VAAGYACELCSAGWVKKSSAAVIEMLLPYPIIQECRREQRPEHETGSTPCRGKADDQPR